ncbi:MAG: hypothetical protein IJQ90_04990 [Alphaproteobacteria bacterium]|nr:hypothetical protein [Alphaproteobacteria bacterium]
MNVKNEDIIRWILLLPALGVVWAVATVISLLVMFLFYVWGYENIFVFYAFLFLMYAVLPFFVARWVAPKYKNIVGIVAAVLIYAIQMYMIM